MIQYVEFVQIFKVPRAGGGTLRQILSECMGAVLAAEPGGQSPFAGDNVSSIEVVKVNLLFLSCYAVTNSDAFMINICVTNAVDRSGPSRKGNVRKC